MEGFTFQNNDSLGCGKPNGRVRRDVNVIDNTGESRIQIAKITDSMVYEFICSAKGAPVDLVANTGYGKRPQSVYCFRSPSFSQLDYALRGSHKHRRITGTVDR